MSLVSAEITKLAINTFVTTKISFANMIGEVCDQFDGADIDEVTSALGSDSRIGAKYLRGALGYGGPCFPRDNQALAAAARVSGVDASVAVATDAINNRQVSRIVDLATSFAMPGSVISIFGMSYKPDTPVCDQSQSIDIANSLIARGFRVIAYDELVQIKDASLMSTQVELINEPSDSAYESSVAILAHPIANLRKIDLLRFRGGHIIDVWGSVTGLPHSPELEVIRPGRTRPEVTLQSIAFARLSE
jgi:UDPglucose 6-dehydrogenase